MNVFILCVGTRDPIWDAERTYDPNQEGFNLEKYMKGPIITFFENLLEERAKLFEEPVRIYLFGTAETAITTSETTFRKGQQTVKFLDQYTLKDCPDHKIFCRPLHVANPADCEVLYPQMRNNLEFIISEVEKEASEKCIEDGVSYIINSQPGTPQMAYVFIALATAGFIRGPVEFLEGIDPKHQKPDESKLKANNISMISQSAVLKRAKSLFRDCHFSQAEDAFRELSYSVHSREMKRKTEVLMKVCNAYGQWDVMQYESVRDGIRNLLNAADVSSYEHFSALRNIFKEQDRFLGRLIANLRETRAVDLYHSAKRRFEQQSYADVIWRCAHIDEMIAVYLASEATRKADNIKKDKLERRMAYDIIDKLSDRSGIVYLKDSFLRDQADQVYSLRNDILHNGYIPTQDDAAFCLNTANLIIRTTFPKATLEDYAFSNGVIRRIHDEVIPVLLVV